MFYSAEQASNGNIQAPQLGTPLQKAEMHCKVPIPILPKMAYRGAIAELGLSMLTGDADYGALCVALSSSLLVGSDVLGVQVMFQQQAGE